MRKPKTTSEVTAIAVVSAVTFLHLAMHIFGGFSWSFITSIVGALFILAFVFNKPVYGWLMIAWATMQMVAVKFPTDSGEFDLAQILSVHFGFTFNGNAGGYLALGLNPIGIAYFVLAIKVKLESIYGRQFDLRPLKGGTMLDEFLPARISIVKRIKLGEENSWYLVHIIEKNAHALIRGKDAVFLKSGEKMIVKFLTVPDKDPILLGSQGDPAHYKNGGWAVIP